MFLPVACLKCGKMFQVPEAAAGTEVACPWCKGITTAIPVSGLPATSPASPPHAEPLSLDDDAPASPKQTRIVIPKPEFKPLRVPTAPPPPKSPGKWILNASIGTVLVVVILAITLAILRYGSGTISPVSWAEFTPPDGSCSIALPGTPTTESVEPTPTDGITRGLQQFTTEGWYSRAKVWFGWRDLDPAWVKHAAMDRDGSVTSPVLTTERDRRKDQVGGKITKEGTVRFGQHAGMIVQMDTPRGKLIEWYIVVVDGPRPRLYFMGIEAKNATAEGAAAQKLFNSFKVN